MMDHQTDSAQMDCSKHDEDGGTWKTSKFLGIEISYPEEDYHIDLTPQQKRKGIAVLLLCSAIAVFWVIAFMTGLLP